MFQLIHKPASGQSDSVKNKKGEIVWFNDAENAKAIRDLLTGYYVVADDLGNQIPNQY